MKIKVLIVQPANNSSSYWIEDFSSNILDEQIFTTKSQMDFVKCLDVLMEIQTLLLGGE